MTNKKNKKISSKALLVTIILMIVVIGASLIFVFNPNIQKKLLGNIISLETNMSEVNTGVVLNNNVFVKNENVISNPIESAFSAKVLLNVYNGADKKITLKSFFAVPQEMDKCNIYTIENGYDKDCIIPNSVKLPSPIVINSNEDYDYEANLENLKTSDTYAVGFYYELDGKDYVIISGFFNSPFVSLNETVFPEAKDWLYTASPVNTFRVVPAGTCLTSDKAPAVIGISNYLHLDVSEDYGRALYYESLNDSRNHEPFRYWNNYFEFYSKFSGLSPVPYASIWKYTFVQSPEALNASYFGSKNNANINNYFDFDYDNLHNYIKELFYEVFGINVSPEELNLIVSALDHESINYNHGISSTAMMYGKPKGIYTKVKVIPGFYLRHYQDQFEPSAQFDHNTSTNDNLNGCNEQPYFYLTTYDKTALKSAIINFPDKIFGYKADDFAVDTLYDIASVLGNASNLYINRDYLQEYSNITGEYKERDINQALVDEYVSKLNNFDFKVKPRADYSRITKIVNEMTAEKRLLYTEKSVAALDSELEKVEYDISSSYQKKVTVMSENVEKAYNNLVLKGISTTTSKVETTTTTQNTPNNTTIKTTKKNTVTTAKPVTSITEEVFELMSLNINGEVIKIKKDLYNYYYETSSDVTKFTIDAKVTVGSKLTIVEGEEINNLNGKIILTVTSKTGNLKTYVVNVSKKDNSNNLKKLEVEDQVIDLSKDETEYEVTIDGDKKTLKLYYETQDSTAKVEVNGNNNLKNGSKVIIKVMSANGGVKNYNIIVLVKENNTALYVGLLLVLLMIIGAITYYLNKKKS